MLGHMWIWKTDENVSFLFQLYDLNHLLDESAWNMVRQLIHQSVETEIDTSRLNPAMLVNALVAVMTCLAGLNGESGANAQR